MTFFYLKPKYRCECILFFIPINPFIPLVFGIKGVEWVRFGFLVSPLLTLRLSLHDSRTKVKSCWIEFAPSSHSESKLSIQSKIIFPNFVNGVRSSFWNKTWSLLGYCIRILVFLWFSDVIFQALYLVRLRVNTSSFWNMVPNFVFHSGSNSIWYRVNTP